MPSAANHLVDFSFGAVRQLPLSASYGDQVVVGVVKPERRRYPVGGGVQVRRKASCTARMMTDATAAMSAMVMSVSACSYDVPSDRLRRHLKSPSDRWSNVAK